MAKVWSTRRLFRLCSLALIVGCVDRPQSSTATNEEPLNDQGKRVLLLSLDGFHEFDMARYIAAHPTSTLASLASQGVHYTNASTAKPTDSFPGTLAMVTGGSPRTTGVLYDNTYSRRLSPPGSNCASTGTEVLYDEGVDLRPDDVNTPMDLTLLPLDPSAGCTPLLPHQYLQVNTIFEVAKAHQLLTAFADKHPSYDLVRGPSGTGVDDLYTPEADANNAACCIDSTEANDMLKVNAVINWIDGFDHTRTTRIGVPAIMAMNFQTPNIAQKEAHPGYTDANGDLSPTLAAAFDFCDQAIGMMVNELKAKHLFSSTMIIVTAKHGNSPVDPSLRQALDDGPYTDLAEAIQPGLTGNVTTDDHAIIWLTDSSKTAQVVAAYQAHAAELGIDTIYSGSQIENLLGGSMDPDRRPDIIVKSQLGVIYTSHDKNVEHGSMFFDSDIHVPILVSMQGLRAATNSTPVKTTQIAATILKAIDVNPSELQAVQIENTAVLPGLGF